MLPVVENKVVEIKRICRLHGVERVDLFGSAAGGAFDAEGSDLDFIVTFERRDPPHLFDRYFGLKEDLEGLFERQVDLVMEGVVETNPHFAKSATETRVPLYAA